MEYPRPSDGRDGAARLAALYAEPTPGSRPGAPRSELTLRITHVLGTDGFAGTERYVVEVAAEQARRGHDVAVVGGSPQEMPQHVHLPVRWSPGAGPREALRSLATGGRRDIVHSHITKGDFVAALAAPLTRGRRISTRHITAPRGYGRAARFLAPAVTRGLTHEIAVSEFVARAVSPRPDQVLVNGVQAQPDADGPRERVVLMAQRLAPEKDTATGLRAWAASGLGTSGWRLVVAGDGTERTALQALAGELGIEQSTEFVGWLPDPTEAFRSAAVFLAPAPGEPCGLSVLEAMAHGLPVVAAASGGHAETVGSAPGARVFPPGDAEAAAQHLVGLCSDADGRSRYGTLLRELQRSEFSLTVHVDRLQRIYELPR
jgi:glycosyltransferase involved in cell wall biosynthesis